MKPIFSAGSARGGTGLLTRMLSVSPEVEIALDPYLMLYKMFRTAVVAQTAHPQLCARYDPGSPVGDYYFSSDGIQLLDLILEASLNLPFDDTKRDALIAALKARAVLSSGDLVDRMNELQGHTYKELFESGLNLIRRSRGKHELQWIGIHENWTVEFLAPLARAFPDAKFFIILRDPRAVMASSLKAAEESQRGQILSFCRGLRKLMACAVHFPTMEVFQNRLLVLRYEDLVINAESECRRLCQFLGVDYFQDMLDTSKYVEPSTGQVYNGFSSFESHAAGISPERIYRWRAHLDDDQTALIDFLCGPEMALFGYEPGKEDGRTLSGQRLAETLEKDMQRTVGWRTDSGIFEKEWEHEQSRVRLLKQEGRGQDPLVVRQAFLFSTVLERVLDHKEGKYAFSR